MIKTAFWGRLKTTVTITFTLNSQFTASSGYAETGVYRVFENDLSMSVWDVLCHFFFCTVCPCPYIITPSIQATRFTKSRNLMRFHDSQPMAAEQLRWYLAKNKTKKIHHTLVIMTISCRRGCTNILQFCHKMFSRNKMFAPQTVLFFFCWFVFCHFIRMFFRMSLDVSLELLQINNKRKSETDFNEASFLLLCWIFGVNM